MSALPQSWVASANTGTTDFPLQNLPYGVFSTASQPSPRVGVAIGDQVLDLAALEAAGVLQAGPSPVFAQSSINAFVALGSAAWRATRARLISLLAADGDAALRENTTLRAKALVPLADATLHLPVQVPGYTDFYSSKEHATNVGSMFRDPANALLPNWLEIPIGYNGRASSVVVSGTNIHRPNGQIKLPDQPRPIFDGCRKLDFELETGFIVGRETALGESLSVDAAEAAIFGMVILNDWSARDLQQWEYVPLGPFNAKTFGTSISPWVVTMEALEPFRVAGPEQHPEPLPYLRQVGKHAFDIELEVSMQAEGDAQATSICRTNFRHMYWSMAQQFAHHTVSGCNVRVGDLMGSGTISGPTPDSFGSLLELTWNGKHPITLASGAKRTFIEDGDTVVMTGWCQGDGYRIGFGEVAGKILPAKAQ
ncbi:fumarylacetoacetase [Pandoraea pnomenusa]|jgi:fumarylacetoacetase|uniref:fumarylacetoacetase n=1 Tax=Pandoraea pnomenusa TaxID=93220 RepID=A0A378YDU1_9BURK|nr:fumarylacetoacetase [Pandoraea pnomenusa]AHN73563.1 fumarylacetoacetase [Pandoraea pnomenusa]AIU25666.1 fumarylacetoacetase [Pandoraea pnomenusa]MBN9093762.1 fumarylacetoacetase [Pandoraea pnomenusa]QDH60041.1 fumarylacetoacetase [Pandoraea pnomenusa]QDX22014.1 fumarylacetoacetase [Pandoraea pnomenusa]